MSFWDMLKQYREDVRKVTSLELAAYARRIQQLEGQVLTLEHEVKQSDVRKLTEQLNVLKAQIEKLSSRLIGFSKTGIS